MNKQQSVYIVGMGIISPWGYGIEQNRNALIHGKKSISPLTLFPGGKILPVGEISENAGFHLSLPTSHFSLPEDLPRTHRLALMAAEEAMADMNETPEAIVMGGTTGGILTTEECLKAQNHDPAFFKYHSINSVAEYLARKYQCKGPVFSISTACSSGTAAIIIAMEMLRSGKVRSVLAGGADSLCRLTYYGFNSLQLIDTEGARPFDKNRNGMNVSEGAAMLFLVAGEHPPEHAIAEILGRGLSCDAYHATAPHPDGKGAFHAMMNAIKDAAISPADIDYINLHGTGTIDNDLSEAKGVRAVWENETQLPPMSSIKGALGHSIAAAGANEAVLSAMCITNRFIPANTGYEKADPEIDIQPVQKPLSDITVDTVLSNSLGFGGNNASIIMGNPKKERGASHFSLLTSHFSLLTSHFSLLTSHSPLPTSHFSILGSACITGAGDTDATLNALTNGSNCKGRLNLKDMSDGLPARFVRRLKRLPRMSLSLASSACKNAPIEQPPGSIFFGTGWGALSETYDFLTKLYESEERFTSPTDFIGSVHNAPAGQMAILFESTGPNITTTAGDYSFEHALFIADILASSEDDAMLVAGADEYHPILSGLLDPSVLSDETPSDGGGAVCLKKKSIPGYAKLAPLFFEYAHHHHDHSDAITSLIQHLGGNKRISDTFGAILVGIPKAFEKKGTSQLREFLSLSGFSNPVIDYRHFIGEFASASAAATVIASRFVMNGTIPAQVCGHKTHFHLKGKHILIMNLGEFVTAVEIFES